MSFSFLLPILVTAVGVFLLIKLRFFFILHPLRTAGEFLSGLKDRDARRSFSLALAGTLGVGNIFGVSAGIMIGGEGSLFWLFLSSIFSAVIKYAEVLLVFDGGGAEGGMAALLSRTLRHGKLLSPIYAGLTVVLSLFMGASMQTQALCDIASQTLRIGPLITVVILVLLLLPALLGGARKIENITEIVIPLTTIIYIIMCFTVIGLNFLHLPGAFLRIISSAFSFKSAAGGITALAIKEGFARGILSNEAGVGTSALAHSRSMGRSPHLAGLFGMCEVLFDTTILCPLTGIAILVSVENFSAFKTPMALVFAAFSSSIGRVSSLLLPIIFAFAYSTLICWFYYGVECCRIYFGGHKGCYLVIFILCTFFSGFFPPMPLIYITDFVLLLMACMTLSAILKKSDRIRVLSNNKELP